MKNLPAIKSALAKILEGTNEMEPLLAESLERLGPMMKKPSAEMGISEKVRVAQFLIANFDTEESE